MASRTAIFVMVIVVVAAAAAEAAVTCGTVVTNMSPCQSYLLGNAPSPSQGCCAGANTLKNLARTTADRRAACQCLKNLATTVRPNIQKALSLASRCNVDLGGITVSPNINCNTIN